MEIVHPQSYLFAAVEDVDVGHASIVIGTSPPTIAHSTGSGVRTDDLCEVLARTEHPIGHLRVMRPWPEAAFDSPESCMDLGERAAANAVAIVRRDTNKSYPDVDLTPYLLRTTLAGLVVNGSMRRLWASRVLRHVANVYRTSEGVTVFCTELVADAWRQAGVTFELPTTGPTPDWTAITKAGVKSLLDDVDKHENLLLEGKPFARGRAKVLRFLRRTFWRLIRVRPIREGASDGLGVAVEWLSERWPDAYTGRDDDVGRFVRLYDIIHSPSLATVYETSASKLRGALCHPVHP
jgi:hypothetical protein